MMKLTIRHSVPEDLEEIERVYAYARSFMKAHGNPNQWGDKSPARPLIESDFKNRTGYVVELDNRIVGVFAWILGEDPTYRVIEDGAWISDAPYGTIHRIASDGTVRGILETVLSYCVKDSAHIRIDTHHDNTVMQHLLDKNGFTRCGIIHLENGDPRIAYERL